jgi:hypothetical protein
VNEARALRIAVALACLVPLAAGLAGMLAGAAFLGDGSPAGISADSHIRYLSGLLFGIGIGFASTLWHIEAHGARFRLLTGIVVLGGLARLAGLVLRGAPDAPMLFGLAMELLVTPLLCLWQGRVASLAAASEGRGCMMRD